MTDKEQDERVAALESALRGFLALERTWRGTVFSTFLNPILFLAAIGVGLGSFVDGSNPSGIEGVSYVMFLAPGILVATAMNTASTSSLASVTSHLWLV